MPSLSTLRRLLSCRDGNVAIIFALCSVPLLAFTGAAIDYGLATRLQAKLQAADDATAIALCQTADSTTAATLQTQASTTMGGYMQDASLTVDTLAITPSSQGVARQITLTSHMNSGTRFSAFTHVATPTVAAASQCSSPIPKNFEIALVLDNTGSMAESSNGQSKMAALKTAAINFVEYVNNNPAFSATTKISIVPFAGAVAVKDPSSNSDYTSQNAPWIDWTGQSSTYHYRNLNVAKNATLQTRSDIFNALSNFGPQSTGYPYYGWNWGGCIETPSYPQNVQDVAPDPNNPDSLYQMYFAPDEPGGGTTNYSAYQNNGSYYVWNSYINDGTYFSNCYTDNNMGYLTAEARGCKYLFPLGIASRNTTAIQLPTGDWGDLGQNGPNWGCTSAPIQRLLAVKTGSNKATLEALLNKMSARGSTNIHEGFMWGWRTLSPKGVFSKDVAPYNTGSTPQASAVNKVIIVMTDGMNDWLNLLGNSANGSIYNALGYLTDSNPTTDQPGSSANPRLQPAHANPKITGNIWDPSTTSGRSAIDGLFTEACTNAKAAPANISVFTIAFSVSGDAIDSGGQTMLQNCASTTDQYFLANDSTALITAFSKIAQAIGALRVSQ